MIERGRVSYRIPSSVFVFTLNPVSTKLVTSAVYLTHPYINNSRTSAVHSPLMKENRMKMMVDNPYASRG